ncbi:MAG: translation initiation factor IF-2 subunit beta [Candidatus Diapherotrites archaeon]|nr:translation initiation factor IF-2 subunit beta [Candidatus Diapherotrites archaeon]
MEYEKMLDRLYMQVTTKGKNEGRMEIPKPESIIEGNKTIIKNFSQFVKTIERDEKQIIKYITKETASSGVVNSGRLILNGKFSQFQIERLFDNYVKNFVLCPECKRPDTKILDRQGVKIMKCEACGAISAIKG